MKLAICEANRALSLEVRRFIENVGDVKEESITDYLVWRWREIDRRFNFVHVNPFNHAEESSRTGADFDLELWFVSERGHVSLAVQAKKFIKRYDSYVNRLRYPDNTKAQMNMLLQYAKRNRRLPFYFIYTVPETTSRSMCSGISGFGYPYEQGGVYMADARVMERYADGKHGQRVSRDRLLADSNPFHCMFCCPLAEQNKRYLRQYFRGVTEEFGLDGDELPEYVKRLLDASKSDSGVVGLSANERERLQDFRLVGVYDMRRDA